MGYRLTPKPRIMKLNRTFDYAKSLIDALFFINLLAFVIVIGASVYALFNPEKPLRLLSSESEKYDVISFKKDRTDPVLQFTATSKDVALSPARQQWVHVTNVKSALGIYTIMYKLLAILLGSYGLMLLRKIFRSTNNATPFSAENAVRISKIGGLFILSDICELINYFVVNALISGYYPTEKFRLVTEIGYMSVFGLIIIAISVVYRKGAQIYAENKLTI